MVAIVAEKQRVVPPRQVRSRQTLERILDALQDLLRTKRFEEITVRELVERSGTSTGSFYARFPTKETLLPALYDRYDAELRQSTSRRSRALDDASLEDVVREIARRVVDRMLERRWLTRAVSLHARQHPELLPDELLERRRELHAGWRSQLLRYSDRITHPDPETAVAFGLFMMITAIREKLVFADAPHASSFELSPDRLADEGARALLAYLGVVSAAGNRDGKESIP